MIDEPESQVWAMGQLNVKGDIVSVMYYFGNPQVKQDLKGAAQLVRLP